MSEPVDFRNNLVEAWHAYRAHAGSLSLLGLAAIVCLPTVVLTGPGMLLLAGSARKVRGGHRPGVEMLREAFRGFPDDYVVGLAYATAVAAFIPTIIGWLLAMILLGPVFVHRAEHRGAGILEGFRIAISTCLEHPSDTAIAAFSVISLNLIALFAGGIGLLVTLPMSALALVQLWEQWSGQSGGSSVSEVYDFRSSV